MDDTLYDSLNQRLIALESKLEGNLESFSQRLSDLEAKFSSFNDFSGNLEALPQQLEQLAALAPLIERLQDNFLMVSDVDTFTSLRDLLQQGRFKEADQRTAQILFGLINKTADTIAPDDIESFPVAPLRIVDRLWRKYSGDRFGLSVQLNVYRELGGDLNSLIAQDVDLFLAFCDRIGWRQEGRFIIQDNWDATLESPQGFLPMTWWLTPYGLKIGNFILARLIKVGF